MKKLVSLIFLLCIGKINSQNNFFSYDGKEMRDKIISIYDKSRSSKEAKSLGNDIYDFYDDLSNEKSKKEFIDLLNRFQEEKIYGYTKYRNFADILKKTDKIVKNKEQWLSNYCRMFFEKGQDYQWIFDNNNAIFDKKILSKDKLVVWGFTSDTELNFKGDTIQLFNVEKGELFCRYGKNDFLYVRKIKGIYDLENLKFYVERAEVDWSRMGHKPEDLYAEIINDTIDLRGNSYQLEGVLLNSKYLGLTKIKGKLKHRTFKKGGESNSLVFESYSNISYDSRSGEYSYKGCIRVDGFRYYLIKDNLTQEKALLNIKRKGKDFLDIEGELFDIEEKKITSQSVYFKMNTLDSTNMLGGPNKFIFDIKNRVLVMEDIVDNNYKAMINSSFYKMSLSLLKIYWNIDTSWVYMTASKDKIIMLSDNYYESYIHKKFRGLNKENPLEKLEKIINKNQVKEYTFLEIAKEMNIPKKDIYWIFSELAKMGYISIDSKTEKVIFFDRFLDLEKLRNNIIDFDNLNVEGREDKTIVFKMNLDDGRMISVNTGKINISYDQNVIIYPYEGRFDMRKNRNILVKEGNFLVGTYNMWGEDTEFDYEEFSLTMKGSKTMSIDIPSIDGKKEGLEKTKTLINRIDSIRGKIFINDVRNKSNKKDSLQYPKFITDKNSYIFYDNPIFMKGNYDRNRFFIKIYPFKKDSIILNATHKKLFFEANVHTEIFPDFEEKIKVQKDYTLGFIRKTPEDGYPIYGDKGKFMNILSLGSNGLRGIGKITYSASESESEDIDFYLDSLKSNAKKIQIKETVNDHIDVPNVIHEKVSLNWNVRKDTMYMKSKTPFNLYNNMVKNDGVLKLTSNNLTGGGEALLRNGRIKSKMFNFRAKDFFSDKMDFALRENNKSVYEFFIDDAYGKIDIVNQKGEFKLNSDSAVINIEPIKFKAFVRNAYWDMNNASVLMKEDGDSLSWIESTSEDREGLRFKAGKATYNLRTKSLSSENVEKIEVSDAIIYPPDNKLVVNRGGLKKIEKALMDIVKKDNKELVHRYKDVNVTIISGKKYDGKGKYIYTDDEGNESYIDFHKIYSNDSSRNISRGEGFIDKKEKFRINSKFDFFGNVSMLPLSKNLRFEGNINIGIADKCKNNIEIGSDICINSNVDVTNIVLNISNSKGKKKQNYYIGLFYNDEVSFNSMFLLDKKIKENIYIKNDVLNIRYNKNDKCYVTESEEGYKNYLYDEDCILKMEGELNFHNMGKGMSMEGFVELEQNMDNKMIKYNDFTYGINFNFDENILEMIQDEFLYKDTIILRDTVYNKIMVFDTIKDTIKDRFFDDQIQEYKDTIKLEDKVLVKEKVDTIVNEISKVEDIDRDIKGTNKTYSFFLNKYLDKSDNNRLQGVKDDDMEDELRRDMVINNISLEWNKETNSFYSKQDKIQILQMNKELFGRSLKGKFEIQRDRISDIITIYFEHPHKGNYYFFRFSKNRVNFYTDNKEIMSVYEELREKGNDTKMIDGEEYEYRTPSEMVIKAFLKKYY